MYIYCNTNRKIVPARLRPCLRASNSEQKHRKDTKQLKHGISCDGVTRLRLKSTEALPMNVVDQWY